MNLDLEIGEMFEDDMPESVTYNPVVGDSVEVDAIISRDTYEQNRSQNGMYLDKRVDLYIQASDISTPDPDGDTITFDSVEWGVWGFKTLGQTAAYRISVVRRELISKKARR